jgi:hypothetical protein
MDSKVFKVCLLGGFSFLLLLTGITLLSMGNPYDDVDDTVKIVCGFICLIASIIGASIFIAVLARD